ncbi:hypothetical protein BDW02DRAFT_110661 [Decorospora gaudefroyi]|uniref:C2H2 type master regulator of conidiophore development brlA n=1 Tax=Decorospora gaudefroyi TaxID=184978 RepID=A0A6A5KA78_9PLEO|nr:hypothetical protein BDW02DRAFT_110661 [Decorospora gaudefroyi]
MYTLLLLAVLLTVLLPPVAASSPIMDYAPPTLNPLHSDTEDMFDSLSVLCQFCCEFFNKCRCVIPQAQFVAAQALHNQHDAFPMSLPDRDQHQTEADLAPIYDWVQRQPLNNEHVRRIDANETRVQPNTIQAHLEDIYIPGDRLPIQQPASRKSTQRRQAPRPGGFTCNMRNCDKTFNRQCELNRHQKTHLVPSERPHKCSDCAVSFLYPKDLHRHKRTHTDPSSPSVVTFRCQHPGCGKLDGFSRRDNLLRHQRRLHPYMVAAK